MVLLLLVFIVVLCAGLYVLERAEEKSLRRAQERFERFLKRLLER